MKGDRARAEVLESEGWAEKFVACEPRLSEAVEAYKEAGFEVHLEPLPKEPECDSCSGEEDNKDDCRVCFEGVEDMFKIIYTRSSKDNKESDDDLF